MLHARSVAGEGLPATGFDPIIYDYNQTQKNPNSFDGFGRVPSAGSREVARV
jgi:hypothetical protein